MINVTQISLQLLRYVSIAGLLIGGAYFAVSALSIPGGCVVAPILVALAAAAYASAERGGCRAAGDVVMMMALISATASAAFYPMTNHWKQVSDAQRPVIHGLTDNGSGELVPIGIILNDPHVPNITALVLGTLTSIILLLILMFILEMSPDSPVSSAIVRGSDSARYTRR